MTETSKLEQLELILGAMFLLHNANGGEPINELLEFILETHPNILNGPKNKNQIFDYGMELFDQAYEDFKSYEPD